MQITDEMYQLAIKIVEEYEGKTPEERAKKALDKLFEKNPHSNPFTEGIIMPCCGQPYARSYDYMKYLPRNPRLKYRDNGDVDNDPESRQPTWVQYNNLREIIRQAKEKGLTHCHASTSVFSSEEIRKDGYKDHNDGLSTISWEPNVVKKFWDKIFK